MEELKKQIFDKIEKTNYELKILILIMENKYLQQQNEILKHQNIILENTNKWLTKII